MSEIVQYVNHGASLITPLVVERVRRRLPLWKAEFAQIDAPQHPHLVAQLQLLADAVEDSADGAYKELPYGAFAAAVFALIPDHKGDLGRADDSSVVRAVLIQHESAFAKYAAAHGVEWNRVSTKP